MSAQWFPVRLKELRKAKGLTQPQLAKLAGLSQQGISMIEAGHRSPSWETVLALAQALDVDCSAFQTPPAAKPKKPTRGRPNKDA